MFFLVTYLTGLTMFWIKYRCVVVTQDAVYVLESSKLSGGARPQSLVGALPRRTQLGPVSGRWGQINFSASGTGCTSAFTATWRPPTMRQAFRNQAAQPPAERPRHLPPAAG